MQLIDWNQKYPLLFQKSYDKNTIDYKWNFSGILKNKKQTKKNIGITVKQFGRKSHCYFHWYNSETKPVVKSLVFPLEYSSTR